MLSFLPPSEAVLEVLFHVFGCTVTSHGSLDALNWFKTFHSHFDVREEPEVTYHQIQGIRQMRKHCHVLWATFLLDGTWQQNSEFLITCPKDTRERGHPEGLHKAPRMSGWVCSKWGGGFWGDSWRFVFYWINLFNLKIHCVFWSPIVLYSLLCLTRV